MKTLFNDGSTVPTAFVTKGRQRVKQYNNNTVYLKNNSTFEIELFNPTTNKVLSKIELNGVSLGSGIVLRPGEHVFLERYLDEARRFLFKTYEVDGNSPTVRKAIENNGKVDVKFYSETINYCWENLWQYQYTTTSPPPFNSPTITYNSGNSAQGMSLGNISDKHVDSVNCFYSQSSEGPEFAAAIAGAKPKSIETGRVEKGSNSNQSFTYDNTSFNYWWSWSSEWKILPLSQKQLTKEDLKVYCTSCGRRKRKSEVYCSSCGKKF